MKQFLIPAGAQSQSVVSKHERSTLDRSQMLEDDHRYFVEAKLTGGKCARVSRDDHVVGAHQNRVNKPELGDGRCDLCNLGVAVGPGVIGERYQPVNLPVLDALNQCWRSHLYRPYFDLKK